VRRVDLIGPLVLLVSIGAVATCVTTGTDDDSSAAQTRMRAAESSAAPSVEPAVSPTSASGVVDLLDESSEAALDTTYQGQQVVSSWRATGTQTLTLDVSHQPGVGTVVRVPGSSGTGSAVMQADTDIFDPTGALSLLLQHYVCTADGDSTVAGRATSVVDVRRPNAEGAAGGPLVARFWIDADTGLLLQREVYDAAGQIVGTSRFASLTMSDSASSTPVATPAPPSPSPSALPPGWTVVMTSAQLASLRSHGWELPPVLNGLSLYDARSGTAPDSDQDSVDDVVQLGYSDGVSTVSLFEQRGRLDPSSVAGWTATKVDGYPVYEHDMMSTRMVWAGDGMVYTLVADAAPDVVQAVVKALPHGDADDLGMMSRAHRGVDRVGSWLDPFH
jgi:MucB/RseB N-terminal domain